MPDGGNVIAFPGRGVRDRQEAVYSAVVYVSCALRALGEPVRLPELANLAGRIDRRLDEAAVTEVLLGGVLADMDGAPPFPLFRRVNLRGEEAWAFSPEYRAVMHEAGLEPNLR